MEWELSIPVIFVSSTQSIDSPPAIVRSPPVLLVRDVQLYVIARRTLGAGAPRNFPYV